MRTVSKLHHLNAWEKTTTNGSSLVTATGIPVVDELLPGGGWPKAGLVEIIVPDEYTDAVALLMPAFARLSRQGRWIAMVNPSYQARAHLFSEPGMDHASVLQVNPHPGRSALWTAESMLRSGDCSVVMAWPNCNTELMDKCLQKSAVHGKALGILFRYESLSMQPSGVNLRLKLEVEGESSALYLVDGKGEKLSGAALI
jgi:cell division inhibitor SulA